MSAGDDAVPAATVILLRDGEAGVDGPLQVLVLRRNSRLAFGGMWVFPGGRVDPGDRPADDDELEAARRAAVREAAEEAGLVIDLAGLVPYSHWTPPSIAPKRFATWFFVAPAPPGTVTVDGGEINAHRWVSPGDALRLHGEGDIELAPPTWITMATLSEHPSAAAVLAWAGGRQPDAYATKMAGGTDTTYALYAGDAGYEDGEADRPGPRHRLVMSSAGWSYTRPDGSVIRP